MQNISCPFMDGLIRQIIEAYRQREELICHPRKSGDLDAMSCELVVLHEKMTEHRRTCLMCCRQTYTGTAELAKFSVGIEPRAAMLSRHNASTVPIPSPPEKVGPLPGPSAPRKPRGVPSGRGRAAA